eukprot:s1545_g9.t1
MLARVAQEEALLQHAKEECDAAVDGAAPVVGGGGSLFADGHSDESPQKPREKPQKERVGEGTVPPATAPVSPETTATPSPTVLETPTSQATTVRALTSEFEKVACSTSPVIPRQRELRDGWGNGELPPSSSETLSYSPTVGRESQDEGVCLQDDGYGYDFPETLLHNDDYIGLAEALLNSVDDKRVKVEKKDPDFP